MTIKPESSGVAKTTGILKSVYKGKQNKITKQNQYHSRFSERHHFKGRKWKSKYPFMSDMNMSACTFTHIYALLHYTYIETHTYTHSEGNNEIIHQRVTILKGHNIKSWRQV